MAVVDWIVTSASSYKADVSSAVIFVTTHDLSPSAPSQLNGRADLGRYLPHLIAAAAAAPDVVAAAKKAGWLRLHFVRQSLPPGAAHQLSGDVIDQR